MKPKNGMLLKQIGYSAAGTFRRFVTESRVGSAMVSALHWPLISMLLRERDDVSNYMSGL